MYEQLKRDAARGVGWAFLSSTSVRILQVITTLLLAKLLVPSDFGIFALANLIIVALTIFRDAGLAQVLIYRQDSIGKRANTAFVLSMIASVLVGGMIYASAPFLGSVFDEASIVLPIRVMSVGLVVSGMANVHLALLDKHLRFKHRAVPEVAGAAAYTIVSIVLAVLGFGAWSLVAGWIALTVVSTIAVWMVSSWRPKLEFDLSEVGVIVGYGKHLMVASLATFAFFQIDNAAIGKWLGVTALGFYSMAFTVCHMPATNLAHVVNRVMFPTYSRLQADLPEMRKVYLRTVRYIAMAAFPVAVGIFVLADPIIRVFYADKWVPAIPLFRLLAFYGLMRSIGCTATAVFMSVGQPGLVRRVSMIQLLVAVPLVYPITTAVGASGVAVLFTTAYVVGVIYSFSRIKDILDVGVGDYFRAVSLPVTSSAFAGVLGWLVLTGFDPSWIGIGASGVMLCSVYGASIFMLDRPAYSEILGLLGKSKGVPEP